jgi:uncharacterized protein
MDILALLLIGAVAGLLAGLLGIGGGAIIVPALVFWFEHQNVATEVIMQAAIGTSLATIVFTAISSIRAHHAHGAIHWPAFLQLTPGVLLGAFVGAGIAHFLPGATLRLLFGLFLWVIAVQLVWRVTPKPSRALPGVAGMASAGGVIGVLSALFGIGGGTISVPFLTWRSLPIARAIATASAVGLPIALAGTAGYVITGWNVVGLPAWRLGYIALVPLAALVVTSMLLAPFGARLAHRLPQLTLRRIFAIVLALLGLRLLWT